MHALLFPICAVGLVHEIMDSIISRPFLLGGRWLGHWLAVAFLWVSHWLPHRTFAQGPVHSLHGIAWSLPPNLTTPVILLMCPTADETHEMTSHDKHRVKLLVSR
jgi:hypothetical protein